jgi:hypothetical protein
VTVPHISSSHDSGSLSFSFFQDKYLIGTKCEFLANIPKNNFLILGFKGKYLKTLAGMGGEVTLQDTFLLDFGTSRSLYLEAPHLGHVFSFSYSFRYRIQSLGQA